MKIAFCGTGAFGAPSLRALVDARFEVALVVTQPDRPAGRSHEMRASPIKLCALDLGLRVEQPERISDPAALDLLRTVAPEVLVVVSYGQILRKPVLDLPRSGCVNIHGSLLPRHRGPSPIQAAILAGDLTTGVTMIRMDEGVDTGPIIAAAPETIRPRDTFVDLHDRLAALGATVIVAAVQGLAQGTIVPKPQDPAAASRCRIIRKEDGRLDWSKPADDVDRAVRALNPWPGTVGTLERKKGGPLELMIQESLPAGDGGPGRGPGAVIRAEGADLVVACGKGALALRRVRPAGKKTLDAAELLRGYGIAEGDVFRPAGPA